MDPREQIKNKIDIVPFIQEFVPLKQMGRNFKALCPFHAEKTPSFVVSAERQIWHCFGCQKGGDIFTFLMEFEKMDFLEALRSLAKRAGVKLPTFRPSKDEEAKERLLTINSLASEFYHYILTSHSVGKGALAYLKKRGIGKKTIDAFGLGFAPGKWDLLFNFLVKKKGYSPTEVENAGLVIKSNTQQARGNTHYDRFRNRITFTLRDHRGNVVGFAGRLLEGDAKEAKYVNTPETALYHKGELFYGLDITKEAIKKENQAILVEGEFDMLSSFQAGVANVAALKGTALTEAQAKLIRRFTQNIALAFDVDAAGDAAARRAIEIADREGLHTKVILPKEGKDPDEVIRNAGIAGWKKAIKETVSIYDFIIDSASLRFDKETPEGKRDIAQEVLPILASIGNEIVKAHFVKKLAILLAVSEEAVLRQMEKSKSQPSTTSASSALRDEKKQDRKEVLEEYLLTILLQKADEEMMKKIRLELPVQFFQKPVLRRIFEAFLAFPQRKFSIAKFVATLDQPLIATVDRLYLFDIGSLPVAKLHLEIERVIREMKTLLLKAEMERLSDEIKLKEKEKDDKTIASLKKKFSSYSFKLADLTQSPSTN